MGTESWDRDSCINAGYEWDENHDKCSVSLDEHVSGVMKETVEELDCDPYDINDGLCGEFARIAKSKLEKDDIEAERPTENYVIRDALEKSYVSHRWVYVPDTGKNYDAECTEGVHNAVNLPIFQKIDDVWDEDEIIESRFTEGEIE